MSATSQYPAADGIVGPYPTRKGDRYGVRLKGFEKFGLRTKADAIYKRDQYRRDKYEMVVSPERFHAQRAKKVTIADLMQLVVDDFKRNNLKSLKDAIEHQRFWTERYGKKLAASVTGSMLKAWTNDMLLTLDPATVNRKVAKLMRGYTIAIEEEEPAMLTSKPTWKKLGESDARSGFFEWADFAKLRAALPDYAQVPATIGYWTGMRSGEIKTIIWPQVTFDDRQRSVRIQLNGKTKNGQPRQVIMYDDLYTVLRAWRETTRNNACLTVCQRNCKPLRSIEDIWKKACVHLGLGTGVFDPCTSQYREYVGPIFHDLRRTGLRNLISAGVDRDTAMSISGHLTDAVFRRYNIVNEANLADAGKKVSAYINSYAVGGMYPKVGMVIGMGEKSKESVTA